MDAKNYTLKMTPEMAEQIDTVLAAHGYNADGFSIREAMDRLLEIAKSPAPDPVAPVSVTESPEYLQLQSELSASRTQLDSTQTAYKSLSEQYEKVVQLLNDADVEALQKDLDTAQAQLAASRHRVDELTAEVESGKLPGNAIVLELDGATAAMLSETCEQLDAAAGHYPQLADFAGVTPGVLLVSMFRRYVKERLTEWFFPLAVLPAARIVEIENQFE
ncbi:MAG: hypothetical protein LBF69_00910 [Prevotellaceae bacterium]|jgi:hypothetical protein|nr:hypothetical protein [Prevotellaceae bacterium]